MGTPGTSAYDELAVVNNSDGKGHGTGSAYPSTPGHFDNAGAATNSDATAAGATPLRAVDQAVLGVLLPSESVVAQHVHPADVAQAATYATYAACRSS